MENKTLNSKPVVLTVSLLILFISGIDMTAVNLTLLPIARDFMINLSQTQWVINAYVLISASAIIAGGRLGDVLGKTQVLLSGLLLFLLGSIAASFAQTFILLIISRLVQGLGAALLAPTSLALLFETYPKEQKGVVSGITTSVMSAAFAIGPFLGGALTKIYSWRMVFLINIPLLIFLIFLVLFKIHSSKKPKSSIKQLDIPGVLTLGVLLFSIVWIIDALGNHNHILLFSLSIIAIIGLILFIISEKHSANPIINIELFKTRAIAVGAILRFLFAISMSIFGFLLAPYVEAVLGYSPFITGILFIPFTIGMILSAPYAGKLVDRVGYLRPLILGIMVSVTTYLIFASTIKTHLIWYFIVLFGSAGCGMGLTRPAIVALIMKATPDKQLGITNSIFNMLNSLGASVGISVTGLVISYFSNYSTKIALQYAMPILMYIATTVSIVMLFISIYTSWHKGK